MSIYYEMCLGLEIDINVTPIYKMSFDEVINLYKSYIAKFGVEKFIEICEEYSLTGKITKESFYNGDIFSLGYSDSYNTKTSLHEFDIIPQIYVLFKTLISEYPESAGDHFKEIIEILKLLKGD